MANARFRGRGPRRRTEWAGFGNRDGNPILPIVRSVTVGTALILSKDAITSGVAAVVVQEYTITRMIGFATFAIGVTTASAVATLAIACGVMREDAISAGVASLPDPEDDPDFEWLYYGSVALINPANALKDGPGSTVIVPFDVWGQRIVRTGVIPFWIAKSEGQNCDAGVTGRYLIKLP